MSNWRILVMILLVMVAGSMYVNYCWFNVIQEKLIKAEQDRKSISKCIRLQNSDGYDLVKPKDNNGLTRAQP